MSGHNGNSDGRRHEVQFYSSDDVLLESFARQVATSLKAGNAAIVLATRSHRESLEQILKAEGFDVNHEMHHGRYIALDAAEMLLRIMGKGSLDVDGFYDGLAHLVEAAASATKKENPRVAVCAECVDLLCTLGNRKAAIRLEEAGNELSEKHSVDILCAYRLSSFEGIENSHAFESVCAAHTAVYTQ
ncbi:MAG TPA: MEDS domain-containing protein [Candidatus Acidoferrum sp.]|nr:MEDS domain-containing protein [Candidatus Acidoferrum sp.]